MQTFEISSASSGLLADLSAVKSCQGIAGQVYSIHSQTDAFWKVQYPPPIYKYFRLLMEDPVGNLLPVAIMT
jgi:hypothetical protein